MVHHVDKFIFSYQFNSKAQMIKIYSNQQIQYNLVYFYFLKGLLYLVKTVPPKYGKWILKGAKMVVGVFPAITVLMVSFASVVIQRYFTQEIELAEKPGLLVSYKLQLPRVNFSVV